jgi:hypothetical protein
VTEELEYPCLVDECYLSASLNEVNEISKVPRIL